MPTTYFPNNYAEASVFLENFFTVATANKDDLGFNDAKLDELKTLKQDYLKALNDKQAADELSVANNAKMRAIHQNANEQISYYNTILKADKSIDKSLVGQLGLHKSDDNLSSANPVSPSDLVVEGFSNGINKLKWKKGANRSNTQYIIEAKIGDTTTFSFVGVTTKATFEHKGQRPGVRTFYRVKAQRSDQESPYSNEAVVY